MGSRRWIARMAVAAALGGMLMHATPAAAVTADEMEQARTIAAKQYLRWANDGSGYLDEISPKTMAELEKKLKPKEKENIRSFKAVAVPTDYAKWGKEELVKYWSVTFFTSPGLIDKGRSAKNRVRAKVTAMKIAAPATNVQDTPEQKASPIPTNAPANASVEPAEWEKEKAAAEAAAVAATDPVAPEVAGAQEIADQVAAADSIAGQLAAVPSDAEAKKEKSSSWVYIVALAILVGVVIWLVVFASKTMNASARARREEEEEEEPTSESASASYSLPDNSPAPSADTEPQETDTTVAAVASPAKMHDNYVRNMADKDEEVRVLHREIHGLREECLRLGEENGRLSSDLSAANREIEALRGRLRAAEALTSAASPAKAKREAAEIAATAASQSAATRQHGALQLYLGRVNDRGLFVRADRQPVADKSVYVLVSQDGMTGTYRVIQDPDVLEMVLSHPEHYLAGGCVAPDITDTDTAEGLQTLQPGTAIFEEGCWRVLRKAKIAYI